MLFKSSISSTLTNYYRNTLFEEILEMEPRPRLKWPKLAGHLEEREMGS